MGLGESRIYMEIMPRTAESVIAQLQGGGYTMWQEATIALAIITLIAWAWTDYHDQVIRPAWGLPAAVLGGVAWATSSPSRLCWYASFILIALTGLIAAFQEDVGSGDLYLVVWLCVTLGSIEVITIPLVLICYFAAHALTLSAHITRRLHDKTTGGVPLAPNLLLALLITLTVPYIAPTLIRLLI